MAGDAFDGVYSRVSISSALRNECICFSLLYPILEPTCRSTKVDRACFHNFARPSKEIVSKGLLTI